MHKRFLVGFIFVIALTGCSNAHLNESSSTPSYTFEGKYSIPDWKEVEPETAEVIIDDAETASHFTVWDYVFDINISEDMFYKVITKDNVAEIQVYQFKPKTTELISTSIIENIEGHIEIISAGEGDIKICLKE